MSLKHLFGDIIGINAIKKYCVLYTVLFYFFFFFNGVSLDTKQTFQNNIHSTVINVMDMTINVIRYDRRESNLK